jgi:hypothetical protein
LFLGCAIQVAQSQKRYLMLRKGMMLGLMVFAFACGERKAAIEDVQKAADMFFERLVEY